MSAEEELRLPDVRFVSIDSLVPHERHDEQRMQPLVRRIREQAVLKNPPIVTPFPAEDGEPERFVLLDGANRAMAAREAGLPHMAVQVVRYEEPDVRLTTWVHALTDLPRPEFEAACGRIPDLACQSESLLHARARLARREALAYVVHDDGSVTAFHGGADLHARNDLLHALVDTYRARRRFYRMATDSIRTARERYPEVTALVVFPHFEPAEVLEIAASGEFVPAGITRHLVRWRALRVNVPLDRLADTTQPLAEKNRWLAGWLREKFLDRQVRFYEEPTVLFDE